MTEDSATDAIAALGGKYVDTKAEFSAQAVMPGGHTLFATGTTPEDARRELLRKVAGWSQPKPRELGSCGVARR